MLAEADTCTHVGSHVRTINKSLCLIRTERPTANEVTMVADIPNVRGGPWIWGQIVRTGIDMTAVIAGEGRRDERIRTNFAQQLTDLAFPCSFIRGRNCIEFLIRVVCLVAEIKKLLIPAQMFT